MATPTSTGYIPSPPPPQAQDLYVHEPFPSHPDLAPTSLHQSGQYFSAEAIAHREAPVPSRLDNAGFVAWLQMNAAYTSSQELSANARPEARRTRSMTDGIHQSSNQPYDLATGVRTGHTMSEPRTAPGSNPESAFTHQQWMQVQESQETLRYVGYQFDGRDCDDVLDGEVHLRETEEDDNKNNESNDRRR